METKKRKKNSLGQEISLWLAAFLYSLPALSIPILLTFEDETLERQPWCCVSITNTKHSTPGASVAKSSPHQNRARQEEFITLAPASFSEKNNPAAVWRLLRENAALSTAEASVCDGQSGLSSCCPERPLIV